VGDAGGGVDGEMGEGRELGLRVGVRCPLYIMLALGLDGLAGSGPPTKAASPRAQ
jgi:hypothetical protein